MKGFTGSCNYLLLLLPLCFGVGASPKLSAQTLSTQTGSAVSAQTKAAEPLLVTIKALDTQLFDAYNHCDVPALSALVADDLEFYHDKTGLSRGKAKFLEDFQKYICGKVNRDLVKESLEVYPLNGYGAVEMGTHRFRHPGHDDTEAMGEAKFVMLWQKTDAGWKLTRVISYDHGALEK